MKKYLLLLSVFFSISVAVGQTNCYHPFPDSAFWRVDYHNLLQFQYPYEAYSYFHYYIAGDTLINGDVHKKIYRSFVNYDLIYWTPPYNPPEPPVSGYAGALRDDSIANKAFFVFPNTTIDSLLYDYNLIVGDTMKGYISQSVYSDSHLVVLSLDSVLINGQYRKRWNFVEDYNTDSTYFIEGVGSSGGLIEPLNTYAVDLTYRYLVCVKDSSGTLFASSYNSAMDCNLIEGMNETEFENKVNCYPNPFSTQTTLQADILFKDATLTVYNSMGRQVEQIKNIYGWTITLRRDKLPGGIYFIRLVQDNKTFSTDKLIISDN